MRKTKTGKDLLSFILIILKSVAPLHLTLELKFYDTITIMMQIMNHSFLMSQSNKSCLQFKDMGFIFDTIQGI